MPPRGGQNDRQQIQKAQSNSANATTASVRAEGLEPSSSFEHGHLKPARLPISPRPQCLAIVPSLQSSNLSAVSLNLASSETTGNGVVRCIEEFETVQRLIAAGMNDCAIARQTGISRCTVRDWRLRPHVRARPISTSACGSIHEFAALFCAALDELGIPWTRPRWFEVAVYRKAAVALLDEFVGPKA